MAKTQREAVWRGMTIVTSHERWCYRFSSPGRLGRCCTRYLRAKATKRELRRLKLKMVANRMRRHERA